MTFIHALLLHVGIPIDLSSPLFACRHPVTSLMPTRPFGHHMRSSSACRYPYGFGGVSFTYAGVPSFAWRRPYGLHKSLWHVGAAIGAHIRGLPLSLNPRPDGGHFGPPEVFLNSEKTAALRATKFLVPSETSI